MLKKIESLRTKPKHIRNRYAFWLALSVTLSIALVWGAHVPSRFIGEEAAVVVVADQSGSSFVRTFGKIIADFKTTMQSVQGAVEYEQDPPVHEAVATKKIDLDALVASSTHNKNIPTQATQTPSTTASTSVNVETETDEVTATTSYSGKPLELNLPDLE